MIEQRTITTGPGLTFDTLTAGPPNAPARAAPPRLRQIVPHMALAGPGARGSGVSRGRTTPARLFARRAAGHRRRLELRIRQARRRRHEYCRWLRAGRPPLSSGRPRLGRQHRLGHRRPLSRAPRLADRAVAPASQRLQPRAGAAGRRAGTPLAASQGVPRSRCGAAASRRHSRWLRDRLKANRCRQTRSSGMSPCSATRRRWRRR